MIPNFGLDLAHSTEIIMYMKFSKSKGWFIEIDQLIKVTGEVYTTFVIAENRTQIYDTHISYQASMQIGIDVSKYSRKKPSVYSVKAKIKELNAQVIPDKDKIDPDISDYQLSENLNSILAFICKYLNN